jgi:hypothetical protein
VFKKSPRDAVKKVRDKLGLYALKTLFGKSTDFSCGFFGPDPKCQSEVVNSSAVGVVFQGPIADESKLIDGLRHYRRLFPESCIVLSTWTGEIRSETCDLASALGISCVESQPPRVGGLMNVNKQIVSTARGIDTLLQQAAPALVMKVRTDYFPWRPDKAVRCLLAHERLLGGEPRIWGVDINTRLDLPFSVADIFQLGRAEVMRTYWTEDPLYPRDISVQEFFELTDHQRDTAAILKLQPAEIYLAVRYLRARNCQYDYTSIIDYHAALAQWFGILDAQHLELAFGKYAFMTPGYEPVVDRKKKYVKAQDWISMVGEEA